MKRDSPRNTCPHQSSGAGSSCPPRPPASARHPQRRGTALCGRSWPAPHGVVSVLLRSEGVGFVRELGGGGGGLPGVRCTHPNPVLGNLVRLVIKVRPAAGKRWLTGWYGVAKQGCDMMGFESVDNGWTANMSACNIIPQILQLRKMRRIPSGQQLICSDSKNSRAYLQPGGGGCSVRLLDGRHPGR